MIGNRVEVRSEERRVTDTRGERSDLARLLPEDSAGARWRISAMANPPGAVIGSGCD